MLSILTQAPSQSSYPTLIMFGAMALIFYFFMIRPQQKKAKEQKRQGSHPILDADDFVVGGENVFLPKAHFVMISVSFVMLCLVNFRLHVF